MGFSSSARRTDRSFDDTGRLPRVRRIHRDWLNSCGSAEHVDALQFRM